MAHLAMLLFAGLIAGSFTLGALTVPYIHAVPLNALRFMLAALMMGLFAFGVARVPFSWPKAPWRFGVGNDPRYNKSRCFEPFPFPHDDTGLTPELTDRIRTLNPRIQGTPTSS